MCEEIQTLIIDNGSRILKSGFSGELYPHNACINAIGISKYPKIDQHGTHKDYYVGDEAYQKIGVINVQYPIKHSIIKNWDTMEKIWDHVIHKTLRIDPSEHPILVLNNVNVPESQTAKVAEIMLEKFNFPSISFQPTERLALLSTGKTTGVVLQCGSGITSICSIYENYVLPQTVQWTKFAGASLSASLISKLNKHLMDLHTTGGIEVAQNIKATVCYVADDYQKELERFTSGQIKAEYSAPDGSIRDVKELSIQIPELLFNPQLFGLHSPGVHQLLLKSILASQEHIRDDMWKHISICGGTTLMRNFSHRLQQEMMNIAPPGTSLSMHVSDQRENAAWIGGSMLASHESFTDLLVSKQAYQEQGSSILIQKCK